MESQEEIMVKLSIPWIWNKYSCTWQRNAEVGIEIKRLFTEQEICTVIIDENI